MLDGEVPSEDPFQFADYFEQADAGPKGEVDGAGVTGPIKDGAS